MRARAFAQDVTAILHPAATPSSLIRLIYRCYTDASWLHTSYCGAAQLEVFLDMIAVERMALTQLLIVETPDMLTHIWSCCSSNFSLLMTRHLPLDCTFSHDL